MTDRPLPTWFLRAGNGPVLGRLELEDEDMPWNHCRFTPEPVFQLFAPFFAEELRLFYDALARTVPFATWEHAYARIPSLSLAIEGRPDLPDLQDLILHVDGTRAWFRRWPR